MEKSYLTRRRDEELDRAANAACDQSRQSHEELARQYAEEIAQLTPGSQAA